MEDRSDLLEGCSEVLQSVCFSMLLYVCATVDWSITKHRPRSIIHPILYSLYTYHPYKHTSSILIKTRHFHTFYTSKYAIQIP